MTALLDVDQLRTFIAIAETGSFSRAYPAIELTVLCDETVNLLERIKGNDLDLAIITNCTGNMTAENFRQERLLWATSNRHSTHLEERLPLALGRSTCAWRRAAI